jgi:hypothetical protein
MATCLLSCYGLLLWIHSYSVSFGMVVVIIAQIHACMPCEAPLMLILMHSISFFSRFVFDEFIAKGGEYGHKVGRTLC